MKNNEFDLKAKYAHSTDTIPSKVLSNLPVRAAGRLSAIFTTFATIVAVSSFFHQNICNVDTYDYSPFDTQLNHDIKLKKLQNKICSPQIFTATDQITQFIESKIPDMPNKKFTSYLFSPSLPQ